MNRTSVRPERRCGARGPGRFGGGFRSGSSAWCPAVSSLSRLPRVPSPPGVTSYVTMPVGSGTDDNPGLLADSLWPCVALGWTGGPRRQAGQWGGWNPQAGEAWPAGCLTSLFSPRAYPWGEKKESWVFQAHGVLRASMVRKVLWDKK